MSLFLVFCSDPFCASSFIVSVIWCQITKDIADCALVSLHSRIVFFSSGHFITADAWQYGEYVPVYLFLPVIYVKSPTVIYQFSCWTFDKLLSKPYHQMCTSLHSHSPCLTYVCTFVLSWMTFLSYTRRPFQIKQPVCHMKWFLLCRMCSSSIYCNLPPGLQFFRQSRQSDKGYIEDIKMQGNNQSRCLIIWEYN